MMFVNSPLPTVVLDNQRKILDVNDALCHMLGLERSQFIGCITNAFSQDTLEYDEEEWNQFLSAGASLGQRNLRHADGSLLAVEYVVKSIYPGLNLVTVVATHLGGVPRDQVYYRLGAAVRSI
jgi:PAS domain S-box-containing protein